MYPFEEFLVRDLAEIRAFVEKYPFATLVVNVGEEMQARREKFYPVERRS